MAALKNLETEVPTLSNEEFFEDQVIGLYQEHEVPRMQLDLHNINDAIENLDPQNIGDNDDYISLSKEADRLSKELEIKTNPFETYHELKELQVLINDDIGLLDTNQEQYIKAKGLSQEGFNRYNEMEDLYRGLHEIQKDLKPELLKIVANESLSFIEKEIQLNVEFDKDTELYKEMITNRNFNLSSAVGSDNIAKIWMKIPDNVVNEISKKELTNIPLIVMDGANLMGVPFSQETFKEMKEVQQALLNKIEVTNAIELNEPKIGQEVADYWEETIKDQYVPNENKNTFRPLINDKILMEETNVIASSKKIRLVHINRPNFPDKNKRDLFVLQVKKPFKGFVNSTKPKHTKTNRELALKMFSQEEQLSKKKGMKFKL